MTIRLARLAAAAIIAIWVIALTASSAGADEGWAITSFDSLIAISVDSTLTVQEDVRVDFGSQQKHGIFRTIPLRYRYDGSNDRYYRLSVVSVTDGNQGIPYTTSVDSDNEVIKIGDPNRLVTGINRYVITYKVQGAMNSFSDHDELFWNVDGALWPVPKQSVTATVILPANSFQKAACYQGPTGSTEACKYQASGDTVSYSSTRPLASGEEMSVVTAVGKGAVQVPPPLLEPRRRQFPQDSFDLNPLTVGLSLLILIVGVALVAWNWWMHGRDREYLTQYYLTNDPRERPEPLFHHDPVVVEFGPPQSLRPAELGVILDERADQKDVTATIVDLAVRGHMTIAEVPGQKDWTLTWKQADIASLLQFEKTLLDGLFAGRKEVKLSELKGTFATTLKFAENQIYSDAMSRKLFSVRPDLARAGWGCLGIGLIVLGCALAFLLGVAFGWGLVGAAVVLVGMVLTVTFRSMSQRTAAGHELLQHTLGFRLYMTTAEKYRQQFAEKAQIFTDLLPYAIVFGCVTQWARAFEGIDTSASSGWYAGTGPFQAALLASSLESLNSSISSAISYAPPSAGSSSGFGGGGFSGGGGGGGGGGSW
ncbi:MAG TPA: DUF2207 domain-containing protein [Candidatus Dormibacteraeota bacterium]|nr:DUF2207 domain-containing protein [Candidatus Dormibacteraeota bacterium]